MLITAKDKKLLSELVFDAKQSNRELSKKVGYAKETIGTKIREFEQNGIIKGFSLKVNYSLLGFQEYHIFVQFTTLKEQQTQAFLNFLIQHPHTTWIGKSFGTYDMKISLIVTSYSQIQDIFNQISKKFPALLKKCDCVFVADKYKAPTTVFLEHLFDEKIQSRLLKPRDSLTTVKLSSEEKSLLYTLGLNPKISFLELSKQFKKTPQAIAYTIKNLEKRNILQGYGVVIDGSKFNKQWCLVLLQVQYESLSLLKTYLQKQSCASSYFEHSGIWNFSITLFAKNLVELHQAVNQLRTEFSSAIQNYELMMFFDFYKYPQVPECILGPEVL